MDGEVGQDAVAPMELTPTEQQLLEHIRTGLVDAEIAVRMGLSNGDVKARVERLVAKLGVDGRDGLRQARPRTEEPTPEKSTVAGRQVQGVAASVPRMSLGIAACLIFAAGLAVGLWLSDNDNATPAQGSPLTSTAAAPSPTATTVPPTPTQVARMETIDGREMAWAGRMFYVSFGGQAVAEVSNREAVSVVTLTQDGYMALNTGASQWRPSGGRYALTGALAGVSFDLYYQPGDEFTRFIAGPSDSVTVFSVHSTSAGVNLGRPVTVLEAIGPGGRRHHLHVALSGDLYIELSPIPATPALDNSTGEALDTSGTQAAGQLPIELSAWAFNLCEPGPCVVSRQVRAQGELAPIAGHVTCPDDAFAPGPAWESRSRALNGQVVTLDSGAFQLHFWRQVQPVNGIPPGELDCPDASDVAAGDPLLPPGGYYLITATSPTGEPLDVVVDGLGNLSVGKIERQFGCPCVSGS